MFRDRDVAGGIDRLRHSMAELTEEQIVAIKEAYQSEGTITGAARVTGYHHRTIKKYTEGDPTPPSAAKPPPKKEDMPPRILRVLSLMLDNFETPGVIEKMNGQQLAVAFGIMLDKHELVTGQPTTRSETGPIDLGRLTPEEREIAAKIRDKLAAGLT
jgi:hypothetical protein